MPATGWSLRTLIRAYTRTSATVSSNAIRTPYTETSRSRLRSRGLTSPHARRIPWIIVLSFAELIRARQSRTQAYAGRRHRRRERVTLLCSSVAVLRGMQIGNSATAHAPRSPLSIAGTVPQSSRMSCHIDQLVT